MGEIIEKLKADFTELDAYASRGDYKALYAYAKQNGYTKSDTIFSTFKRELKKIYIDYDKIANESDPKEKIFYKNGKMLKQREKTILLIGIAIANSFTKKNIKNFIL